MFYSSTSVHIFISIFQPHYLTKIFSILPITTQIPPFHYGLMVQSSYFGTGREHNWRCFEMWFCTYKLQLLEIFIISSVFVQSWSWDDLSKCPLKWGDLSKCLLKLIISYYSSILPYFGYMFKPLCFDIIPCSKAPILAVRDVLKNLLEFGFITYSFHVT